MQQLLQPRRADSVGDAMEPVERWEYDVRTYEARFSKTLDDDIKIGVILSTAPTAVQSRCRLRAPDLKSYGAGAACRRGLLPSAGRCLGMCPTPWTSPP